MVRPIRSGKQFARVGADTDQGFNHKWQAKSVSRHLGALGRTDENADILWHMLLEPPPHCARLFLSAVRQTTTRIGQTSDRIFGFGMAPKNQIHRRLSRFHAVKCWVLGVTAVEAAEAAGDGSENAGTHLRTSSLPQSNLVPQLGRESLQVEADCLCFTMKLRNVKDGRIDSHRDAFEFILVTIPTRHREIFRGDGNRLPIDGTLSNPCVRIEGTELICAKLR